MFTEVPLEEINEYEKLEGADLNKVKVRLADEATKLLHGGNCLVDIHNTIASLFSGQSGGGDWESLPKVQLMASDLNPTNHSIQLIEVLVRAGMVSSKAEGRRLIKAGGVKVNDIKVDDELELLCVDRIDAKRRIKISAGKKKHAVVSWPID